MPRARLETTRISREGGGAGPGGPSMSPWPGRLRLAKDRFAHSNAPNWMLTHAPGVPHQLPVPSKVARDRADRSRAAE